MVLLGLCLVNITVEKHMSVRKCMMLIDLNLGSIVLRKCTNGVMIWMKETWFFTWNFDPLNTVIEFVESSYNRCFLFSSPKYSPLSSPPLPGRSSWLHVPVLKLPLLFNLLPSLNPHSPSPPVSPSPLPLYLIVYLFHLYPLLHPSFPLSPPLTRCPFVLSHPTRFPISPFLLPLSPSPIPLFLLLPHSPLLIAPSPLTQSISPSPPVLLFLSPILSPYLPFPTSPLPPLHLTPLAG